MRLSKHSIWVMVWLFLCPSTLWAFPSDPNNAALLYYQAFLSFPGNDNNIPMPLDPSPTSGLIEPNQVVRDYLEACHTVFEFTEAAVKLPCCDWGLRHSLGESVPMPHSMQIRQLAFHVMVKAQVCAADKAYQESLTQCLILHKIAQHMGDENLIAFLVSNAIHGLANRGVRDTLGLMPANHEILSWLEQELVTVSQGPDLVNALATEEQITLRKFHLDKDTLIEKAIASCGGRLDPKWEQQLRTADPAFMEVCRAYYVQSMAMLRKTLQDTTGFETKYRQIRHQDEQVSSDPKNNPQAIFTAVFRPDLAKIYALLVKVQSNDNLLSVAIYLYKHKAQVGVLPETLPAGLPKNLFNGKNFGYEKTKEGFILRVETRGLGRDKPIEYGFKVK